MLIVSQKPNASYVAGFRTWNQLGRYVKKGEKGIVILAPVLRRKEKENEEPAETTSAIAGFRPAYVFDITQTDGKELPAMGTVQGDPKDSTVRLQAFARVQGISLEYSDEIAPARGVSCGGKVILLPGQTPAEEFSTLTHELAHELLHRGERRSATSKRIRETEAEAAAFVVTSAIGFNTGSAHPALEWRCRRPDRESFLHSTGRFAAPGGAHRRVSAFAIAVALEHATIHSEILSALPFLAKPCA